MVVIVPIKHRWTCLCILFDFCRVSNVVEIIVCPDRAQNLNDRKCFSVRKRNPFPLSHSHTYNKDAPLPFHARVRRRDCAPSACLCVCACTLRGTDWTPPPPAGGTRLFSNLPFDHCFIRHAGGWGGVADQTSASSKICLAWIWHAQKQLHGDWGCSGITPDNGVVGIKRFLKTGIEDIRALSADLDDVEDVLDVEVSDLREGGGGSNHGRGGGVVAE